MVHKRIRIPRDTAVEVMTELGKLDDAIEFIDLTKDDLEAKKNFSSMIRRCDEMEKRIGNFERITEQHNEKFVKYQTYKQFISDLEQDERLRDRKFGSTYYDLLEGEIFEDEKRIMELIESYTQISENLENLIEKKSVFDKSSQLVMVGENAGPIQQVRQNMMVEEEGYRSDLNFVAGVIKAEDDIRMKRMIFRISKGRALPTFFDLVSDNKNNVHIIIFIN
jgi:V-type H+-transporting ATPase subunit a